MAGRSHLGPIGLSTQRKTFSSKAAATPPTNVFLVTPMYIDDFSSAIDMQDHYRNGVKVWSIQWVRPTTVGHTCTIKSGTAELVAWECAVAKQKIEHYYDGMQFEDLNIDASGVGSGKLIITIL